VGQIRKNDFEKYKLELKSSIAQSNPWLFGLAFARKQIMGLAHMMGDISLLDHGVGVLECLVGRVKPSKIVQQQPFQLIFATW
jgi:hypothetical protein